MLREVRDANHIKWSIENRECRKKMKNNKNKKRNKLKDSNEKKVITNTINIKAPLSIIFSKIKGLNMHIKTIRLDYQNRLKIVCVVYKKPTLILNTVTENVLH